MSKTSELAHLFRTLKAPAAARALPKLAERAREESWSYERFAEILLGTEVAARESHGGEARIKAARFPARKTLEWVAPLADAKQQGTLEAELRRLSFIPLIVVDEVGYIPFDPEAANLMFSLVSSRYERASMIVTSNKPFSAWGEIFGDETVAAAMIDRLVHHAEILLAQRRQLPPPRPRPRRPPTRPPARNSLTDHSRPPLAGTQKPSQRLDPSRRPPKTPPTRPISPSRPLPPPPPSRQTGSQGAPATGLRPVAAHRGSDFNRRDGVHFRPALTGSEGCQSGKRSRQTRVRKGLHLFRL